MAQYIYVPDPKYKGARIDDGGVTRKVRLQVQTNNPHLNEADIQLDSGFKYGDPDPLDATKTLRSIEVQRETENPYFWDMLLEYRSDVIPGGDPGTNQIPPLERPPEFDWSFEEHDEQIDDDITGQPIITTGNEFFDPPHTRPFADLVARVTFYATTWDAVTMRTLVNGVNDAEWYGWPAGSVRFCAPRARSIIESPWPACFQITYTFACRPDGWRLRVLNQGLQEIYLDAQGNKKTRQIKTDDGKLIEKPWPLDEDGKKIPMGEDGKFTKPLVWLYFPIFKPIDFSQFGV